MPMRGMARLMITKLMANVSFLNKLGPLGVMSMAARFLRGQTT